MLIVGRGKERMCRGYMKRLRRHQSMVTLGLGAGAVSLGSHTDTVRRDAPTCLAMQGPGDQVVLALGHTVPGTDQCEGMEAVEVRLPDGALALLCLHHTSLTETLKGVPSVTRFTVYV